jgi:hypothetical protein
MWKAFFAADSQIEMDPFDFTQVELAIQEGIRWPHEEWDYLYMKYVPDTAKWAMEELLTYFDYLVMDEIQIENIIRPTQNQQRILGVSSAP